MRPQDFDPSCGRPSNEGFKLSYVGTSNELGGEPVNEGVTSVQEGFNDGFTCFRLRTVFDAGCIASKTLRLRPAHSLASRARAMRLAMPIPWIGKKTTCACWANASVGVMCFHAVEKKEEDFDEEV